MDTPLLYGLLARKTVSAKRVQIMASSLAFISLMLFRKV